MCGGRHGARLPICLAQLALVWPMGNGQWAMGNGNGLGVGGRAVAFWFCATRAHGIMVGYGRLAPATVCAASSANAATAPLFCRGDFPESPHAVARRRRPRGRMQPELAGEWPLRANSGAYLSGEGEPAKSSNLVHAHLSRCVRTCRTCSQHSFRPCHPPSGHPTPTPYPIHLVAPLPTLQASPFKLGAIVTWAQCSPWFEGQFERVKSSGAGMGAATLAAVPHPTNECEQLNFFTKARESVSEKSHSLCGVGP